jgi:hypothetical protein
MNKRENTLLRRDEMAASQTHKYAHVVKAHKGTDRMIRSSDIECKLTGEEKFRVTT